MGFPASGSAPGVAADGQLRLVPFSFWLPFGRDPHAWSGGADCAAGASSTSGMAPSAPTERPLPQGERRESGPAAGRPASNALPPSLAALQQAMGEQLAALGHPGAEPLRWAITGADPHRGLRLEGIGLSRASLGAGPNEATAPAAASGQASPGITTATDQP